MKIVLMGPKGAGKSTVGRRFAEIIGLPWVETDQMISELDARERSGAVRSCREIFRELGESRFRSLEKEAAAKAAEMDFAVITTGGGLMMDPESRALLRRNAILVWIDADNAALWERLCRGGLPPWLDGPDPEQRFFAQCDHRREVLRPFADIVLQAGDRDPDALAEELRELLSTELSLRQYAPNTWGDIIRVTTFGESHGTAIGAVLDGIRPGIPISEEEIQRELDRRRCVHARNFNSGLRRRSDFNHQLQQFLQQPLLHSREQGDTGRHRDDADSRGTLYNKRRRTGNKSQPFLLGRNRHHMESCAQRNTFMRQCRCPRIKRIRNCGFPDKSQRISGQRRQHELVRHFLPGVRHNLH